MNDKQKAFTAVLLIILIGAGTPPITKIGLFEIPPLSFAFIRFVLASFLILPFFLIKKRSFRKDFKRLVLVSLLATGNIIFFVLGIKLTTANISQLIYAGVPIITAFILYGGFGQKLSPRNIFGIALGFIATLIILLLPILERGEKFAGDLRGNVFLLIAVVMYSLYVVFTKRLLNKYSPFEISSIFIFVTTIALLPFFIFDLSTKTRWWESIAISGSLSMIYVVLFTTIASYVLNQYAIKHGGVVFYSMVFYLTPFFGFLAAFLLLGERLTPGLITGAIFVLLGTYIATQGKTVKI